MTGRRRQSEVPPQFAERLAEFPAALRALVLAELAAGNEITEISNGFPAAPCGQYLKLARAVSTRPREDGGGLSFYDRNGRTYSGEWHDGKRHWFVLEPPHPPEPEPDQDAIRDARYPTMRDPPKRPAPEASPAPASASRKSAKKSAKKPASKPGPAAEGAVARFAASMVIDYEKWHDGVGYDIDALRATSAVERAEIEAILLERGAKDWRDVEALAALDTESARKALRAALKSGDHEIRLAVQRHAPHLVAGDERTASLVRALEGSSLYGGLSQAIDEAEEFHPPEVMDALFRGALHREGEAAVHFAALLEFLHGKAAEPFDWSRRPFYLKFHATDRSEREALFRELCRRCGVDAAKWLQR
jgi:hypothetical protein